MFIFPSGYLESTVETFLWVLRWHSRNWKSCPGSGLSSTYWSDCTVSDFVFYLKKCVFFKGGCGGIVIQLFSMVSFFAYTCPNRSGADVIDNPDRFEQVFDPYYILEVLEKIFTHDISMVRRQKMLIFGVLKAFISKFTYYNLY